VQPPVAAEYTGLGSNTKLARQLGDSVVGQAQPALPSLDAEANVAHLTQGVDLVGDRHRYIQL
jgi:hypothetical protein